MFTSQNFHLYCPESSPQCTYIRNSEIMQHWHLDLVKIYVSRLQSFKAQVYGFKVKFALLLQFTWKTILVPLTSARHQSSASRRGTGVGMCVYSSNSNSSPFDSPCKSIPTSSFNIFSHKAWAIKASHKIMFRGLKIVCKEILEEIRLFISENMSGRQSNQFQNVATENMKVRISIFPMQDVRHTLVNSKKTKYSL